MPIGTIPIYKKKGVQAQLIVFSEDHPEYSVTPWVIDDGQMLGFTLYHILPAGTLTVMLNTIREKMEKEKRDKMLIKLREEITTIIYDRGEGFLNDDGVDEIECQDVSRDIIAMIEKSLKGL